MTKKVFALDTKPGIQRDGTLFDKEFYVDGQWVRFQRGRPRKIGGYRQITDILAGPSRGIFVVPRSNFSNVYSGYSDGLQVLPIDNNGIGSGIVDVKFGGALTGIQIISGGTSYTNGVYTGVPLSYVTSGNGYAGVADITVSGGAVTAVTINSGGCSYLPGEYLTAAAALIGGTGSGFSIIVDTISSCFTPSENNLWQFDAFTDSSGNGLNYLIAHAGQNLNDINNEINTRVIATPLGTDTMTIVGAFEETAATITSGSATITLATANLQVGFNQLVRGPGIPAGARVVSVSTTTVVIDQNATATYSNVPIIFDNDVSVSGGVVSLHPYLFVYGNNGQIRNCAAGNFNDWVSADANEANMATGKIVKGLPVRGGSNSPSGLFWSLDSLIRVSYNPTSITVGGTSVTQFWRYDVISSQSSMLSSQSVIEYDGIYYWVGVDRFLLYNGVVKEIPNSMNQNFFFDNLNYAQRQKVYATKVPRFGEIWWFYPRGNSTECNDCIIYNVRENVWYDAGTALGARRSAGYFSQVFRFPVNAGVEINATGALLSGSITNAGTGYTDDTYTYLTLTGGTGSGATATVVVSGGIVVSVEINDRGTGYTPDDILTATFGSGSNFAFTVTKTMSYVSLWQHEIGTDEVVFTQANAIEAFIETSDLGWVAGGPAQPSPVGENRWLHLERLEPDFIQNGPMELFITGRPFAQAEDKTTGPYAFVPGTTKIDLREQRRELRLKFVSNVAGGDFQMGRVIVNADLGDVRGYS
jgi:hypothetical protein